MFTLGFDVAKAKVDVALINKASKIKGSWEVANTPAALTELLATIQTKHPRLRAGCEATGQYHFALIRVCLAQGIELRVLNPIVTKQYTRSTIRGRKTDRDDALTIARLTLRGEGTPATTADLFMPKRYLRLATKIVRQRQALGLQQQFLVHLEPKNETNQLFTTAMEALDILADDLRALAATDIDPTDSTLLQTIIGIGPLIATTILAEIGDITRFPSAKQLIAFAGLDPKVRQSGTTLHRNTRLTKRGSPELRRVLFMAAGVARQYDPELRCYYERRRAEGKAYTPSVVAVAQKLTNRIYAVLTRGTPYLKHELQEQRS